MDIGIPEKEDVTDVLGKLDLVYMKFKYDFLNKLTSMFDSPVLSSVHFMSPLNPFFVYLQVIIVHLMFDQQQSITS